MLTILLFGCSPSDADSGAPLTPGDHVLGSVVITPEGRTTYFQVLPSLDPSAKVTNTNAVEAAGNGVLLTHGRDIFLGLAEAPEWVRYSVDAEGHLAETGRMSLAGEGFSAIDYGNTIVDGETAVSVSSTAAVAVVWNPSTMEIVRTVALPHLVRDGYAAEVWTTVSHDGMVYIPVRWSDWDGGRIYPGVATTLLDPSTGTVRGVAEDDRCASGGRVLFGEDGAAYVMGDGRSYSSHMFANAAGETAAPNCILRILPGATDFDPDYYVAAADLTGGHETVSELESARQGSGVGFTWVFYEEELPDGVEPVDFGFWSYPVFKLWRFTVGEDASATEVTGMPFGVLGFGGSAVDDRLYMGLGDTETSTVYEVDPTTGAAAARFTMDGYFYGLFALE